MSLNIESAGTALVEMLGESAAKTFFPGLTDIEIDQLVEGTPFILSADVRALFRWRNGQDVEDESDVNFPFLIYVFLPLDVAIACGHENLELESDWKETWLPILSDDGGNYYFCDCSVASAQTPVYRYTIYAEGIRIRKAFSSVLDMLQAAKHEAETD